MVIFDLDWPEGLQEGLSQPVTVLINLSQEVLSFASRAGFRCFNSVVEFKQYVVTTYDFTLKALE